jgi:hypothetical protein
MKYCCRTNSVPNPSIPYYFEINEQPYQGSIPGMTCRQCGESIYDGTNWKQFIWNLAVETAQSGIIDPGVFRIQRSALDLTGVDLAVLLGTSPNTLSRWETRERALDRNAAVILSNLILEKHNGQDDLYRSLLSHNNKEKKELVMQRRAAFAFTEDNNQTNNPSNLIILEPGRTGVMICKFPCDAQLERIIVEASNLDTLSITQLSVATDSVVYGDVSANTFGPVNWFNLTDYFLKGGLQLFMRFDNKGTARQTIKATCHVLIERQGMLSRR